MTCQQNKQALTGRRQFIGGALAGVAGGALIGSLPSSAQAGEAVSAAQASREPVLKDLHPRGAPAADTGYSPGVLAEGRRLVLVSGQGPRDLDSDMETQMRQTMERIGAVLEAAGGSMQNVVMLRSYFVHLSRDLPVYRKIRKDYLSKPYPASTAVGVTELAIPGLEIEIEAVAVL